MTARPTVPPMRRKGPPDALIPTTAPEPAAAGPRHVKVTSYMPPGMVADLDELRAELRRQGITADRGALIRAAIAYASADPATWRQYIRQEAS